MQVTLRELDLSWNSISPKGCSNLLAAMTQNQTLKAISLAWNRLGNPGSDAVCTVFKVRITHPFNVLILVLMVTVGNENILQQSRSMHINSSV